MSIVDVINPALARYWDVFLTRLRANDVARFVAGDIVIEFHGSQQAPPSAAQPSTPEQSGTADRPKEEPDIFDVLTSGKIPGAPRVEHTAEPIEAEE